MIRMSFKRHSHGVIACLAVVFLGGLAAAQNSNPIATAPAQDQTATEQHVATTNKATANEAPRAPVTVLEDTLIRVMTVEPVNGKRVKNGSPVLFTVSEDVRVGDVLAIPRGATVHGVVIMSKKAGVLTGSPELTLQLVSLELGGRSYPLDSYQFKVKGTSKTRPTETKAVRGAYVGAVVGSFVSGVTSKGVVTPNGSGGRAASMATGAALGAGVGTAVSAASPGPGIWISSEAQVDFYLAAPVTVTPVSAKEAARLAHGLYPGGPTLYVRDDTP
jgi:hypothetical protein